MPTQEERLSTLEQVVTALRDDIRYINQNEAMLLGLVMQQQEDGREMRSGIETINVHLNSLEDRFSRQEHRVENFEQNVNGRFETLERSMNSRFETQQRIIESFEQSVNGRFETLEQSVNGRFEAQDKRFDAQDRKLDQILLLLNTLTPKPDQQA